MRPQGRSWTVAGWGWVVAAMALCALVVAGGCQSGGKSSPGQLKHLTPRDVPFLEGIAVPSGFKLVDKNTEDYESGTQRWARHEYAGRADIDSVRRFYREQMPRLGWTRVADHNIQGTVSLRFERRSEACDIVISSSGVFNRTKVQAVVLPFSRAPSNSRLPVP